MDSFRVVATDVFGEELSLVPSYLRLRRGLSSPADGMSGSFPVERRPLELVKLRVLRGDNPAVPPLFEGNIDEQRMVYSSKGMVLELEARSKGAALLDNEAMPEIFEYLTANALFQKLIAPHGFVLVLNSPAAYLTQFTVRKGQTLWDAFSTYTRRVYGRVPYVSGDMVVVSQSDPGDSVLIGGESTPFSRLEQTISHYHPISQVIIRDDEGNYQTSVSNQNAAVRGIRRVRYLIPSGEFAAIPRWDATARIRRSMRQMETVRVELPGFWEIRPGRGVIIQHPKASLPNLLVDEYEFTLDVQGARTSLTMANALYD